MSAKKGRNEFGVVVVEEKNTEPVKSRETQSEKKDAAEQIVREENEAGKSSKGLFTFRF